MSSITLIDLSYPNSVSLGGSWRLVFRICYVFAAGVREYGGDNSLVFKVFGEGRSRLVQARWSLATLFIETHICIDNFLLKIDSEPPGASWVSHGCLWALPGCLLDASWVPPGCLLVPPGWLLNASWVLPGWLWNEWLIGWWIKCLID